MNEFLIDFLVLAELEEPELQGADHEAPTLTGTGLALRDLPRRSEGIGLLLWGLGRHHPRENRLLPWATRHVALLAEP